MGMMLRRNRQKDVKPAEKPVEKAPEPKAEEVKKRGPIKQAKA